MTEIGFSSTLPRLLLVTGPSGAGRSTAINVLEDLGFEVIDNLPLSLVPRLLDGPPMAQPLALGIDVRNRDFSSARMLELIDKIDAEGKYASEILYIDASADVLIRRFSETRRRHPLSPAESPRDGVARELDLLTPIRSNASILIDTSEMTVHDLRGQLTRWFAPGGTQKLALSLHSFSYKRGTPRGIDMIFDCRFLRNPYWEPSLRGLNGTDYQVADYVAEDRRFNAFFGHVQALTEMLLPAYVEEGKSHLSIGFGCTGGQHRSVTLTERLATALAENGWQVSKRHRELERRSAPTDRPILGK